MSLTWVSVAARTGGDLIELPGLDVGQVSVLLGEYQTTTASLPVPTAPVGWQDAIVEGARVLVLLEDDAPVWGGMVLTATGTQGDAVSMSLATVEAYLGRRYVGDASYAQVGQNAIVADLVARFATDGALPGLPFEVVQVGGAGALSDRAYADTEDKTVLSALQELADVEGGPAWTVRWERRGDLLIPVLYVGDLGAEVLFTLTLPGNVHTAEHKRDFTSGAGANRVVTTSSGQGSSRPQSPPQPGPEDDGRPTFEMRYSPSTSVTDLNVLSDHARSTVTTMASGTRSLVVSLVAEHSGLGRHWSAGDRVPYDLTSPSLGHLTGTAQVLGWTRALTGVQMVSPVLDVTIPVTPPRFNSRLSLYNPASRQLSRWRAARARAASGTGSAHITAFVDSITFGYGQSAPVGLTSWPARLRGLLEARHGFTGTGIIPLLDGGSGQADAEPRMRIYGGASGTHGGGPYGLGSWGINDAAGAGVELGPVLCNQVTLWYMAGSDFCRLYVDASLLGTFRNDNRHGHDDGTLPASYRYIKHDNAFPYSGLQSVTINLPSAAEQTVRFAPPVGGHLWPLAIEARYGTTGVRVSNLAQSSMSTVQMVYDDPSLGSGGMSLTMDAPRADLSLFMVGMNDFQGHHDVPAFINRVRTAVLRQRLWGDVLLVIPPRPDFATTPIDGIQVPPMSAYDTALYYLADELDVPLLDVGDRWGSWALSSSEGWHSDRVHLSDAGASALAADLLTALDTL